MRGLRTGMLAVLTAACLLLGVGPAAAHAELVGSDPANGAVLASAPHSVHLQFSEDVAARFTSVRLLSGSGHVVPGTRAITAPDGREVQLALPRLGNGGYAVVWKVLASDDGHFTNGTVVFEVGGAANPVAVPTDQTAGQSAAAVALRWTRLALLAGAVGPLTVALLVLAGAVGPRGPSPDVVRAARRRLLLVASACAPLAVAVAPVEVAVAGSGSSLAALLGSTRGGHLLVVQMVLCATLSVTCLNLHKAVSADRTAPPAAGVLVGLLVAGIAATEALRSHAAGVDAAARGAALVADASHVAAALLWLGALPALVLVLLGSRERRELLRWCRRRFSLLAFGSAAGVVATGLYGAGREVPTLAELTGSRYGHILLAKAGGLALITAAAMLNNARLHERSRPQLLGTRGQARLVLVEAAIGGGVLVAAALLSDTAPPLRPTTSPAAATSTVASGGRADLVVTVSASPGTPGLNAVTVVAASSMRPAPAPVAGVRLRLDGARPLALRRVERDRYVTTARLVAGLRSVEVQVARQGRWTSLALAWPRKAPPPVRPRAPLPPSHPAPLPPTHRLSAWTDPLAGLVLVGAVAAAGLTVRRRTRRRPLAQEVLE